MRLTHADVRVLALCAVALLLTTMTLHGCAVAEKPVGMPDQLALPMPLDDGTRNEIAVYGPDTEVE